MDPPANVLSFRRSHDCRKRSVALKSFLGIKSLVIVANASPVAASQKALMACGKFPSLSYREGNVAGGIHLLKLVCYKFMKLVKKSNS
jgi:hypothetical protein